MVTFHCQFGVIYFFLNLKTSSRLTSPLLVHRSHHIKRRRLSMYNVIVFIRSGFLKKKD